MTRNRTQLFAIVGAVLMIASLVAPAAAGAAVAEEEPEDLTITVSDDNVVTVNDTDGPVEGANVTLEVVDDDVEDEEEAEEEAEDEEETEEEDYTYDGTEEYTTDENGTVELPTPEDAVEVTLTATDGDRTGETTVTLSPDDAVTNFGQEVSSFVATLQDENVSGPMGIQVAQFVLDNNPAADKIPDHAGPPENVGPDGDDEDKQGPPANAGPGDDDADDDEQGPPANAGPGGDDADETEEQTDDGDDADA